MEYKVQGNNTTGHALLHPNTTRQQTGTKLCPPFFSKS